MRAGITKLNICTSIASRAQPPTHAPNARFSRGARLDIQVNAPVSLATAFMPWIVRQNTETQRAQRNVPVPTVSLRLLSEFELDVDCGEHLDRLVIQKSRFIAPLPDRVHRCIHQVAVNEIQRT